MTIRQISEDYQSAKTRLFMLDYDGTLADFAFRPEEARPDGELLDLLQNFASDPANTVVIISGRDKNSLENWLGRLPLSLISEHGLFFKNPGQPWQEPKPVTADWKDSVRKAMSASTAAVQGSFIEEKTGSLVWHFRTADRQTALSEVPVLLERLRPAAARYSLTLMRGNKNVEAKLSIINKGEAARTWLDKRQWDFILAAGDDTTDEDLFSAMPAHAHTVKIGPGESKAASRLTNPAALRELLQSLVKA